ncbi:hypothetical protein KPL76_07225 [Subtercola sp. PAMC28395]|uniref:hypothetical protein n=1 Tax=Subtercola sp. PAMC28395 TaxID=2846775 RepID=UPI001C0ABD30|nr:hypothetical protein [Subtercola sp. PAMC28395]QWT25126.1 hypothetical protein KPL76_07225 [Subtercola sp. PAMC28395]
MNDDQRYSSQAIFAAYHQRRRRRIGWITAAVVATTIVAGSAIAVAAPWASAPLAPVAIAQTGTVSLEPESSVLPTSAETTLPTPIVSPPTVGSQPSVGASLEVASPVGLPVTNQTQATPSVTPSPADLPDLGFTALTSDGTQVDERIGDCIISDTSGKAGEPLYSHLVPCTTFGAGLILGFISIQDPIPESAQLTQAVYDGCFKTIGHTIGEWPNTKWVPGFTPAYMSSWGFTGRPATGWQARYGDTSYFAERDNFTVECLSYKSREIGVTG